MSRTKDYYFDLLQESAIREIPVEQVNVNRIVKTSHSSFNSVGTTKDTSGRFKAAVEPSRPLGGDSNNLF